MARHVETIHLEPHDDVVSVRDQLAFVEARRVLLVWPQKTRILRRKLDLVLIQREARRRSLRLAIVSQDLAVIDNARELNISTFATVEESQRQRWKRGQSKVFVDRSDKPESDPSPDELRNVASRLQLEQTPTQIAFRRTIRGGALLLFSMIIFVALYYFVPSATITLTPARERLDVTIRIVADPAAQNVDIQNSIVPAQVIRIEVEESATVETSGTLDAAETLASGLVVFTNQTDQATIIPAGTTVSTATATIVRFRTIESLSIDGQVGAIAAVAAEALPDYAGPQGNVSAFAINHIDGPLNGILTAQNPEPMQGGTTPSLTVVSQADYDRLLAAARQAIQQRALDDLAPLLGAGQEVILETIAIVEERPDWTTFDANVEDRVDSVSITMRAAVQAVVIDQRHVNQAAFAGLAEHLPETRVVVPDSMTFSRGSIEAILPDGSVTFLTNVASNVVAAVDAETLRQELSGRGIDDAMNHLYANIELDSTTQPAIVIWPEFFGKLPALPARITIIVRETP